MMKRKLKIKSISNKPLHERPGKAKVNYGATYKYAIKKKSLINNVKPNVRRGGVLPEVEVASII